jgi:hypothetical protein
VSTNKLKNLTAMKKITSILVMALLFIGYSVSAQTTTTAPTSTTTTTVKPKNNKAPVIKFEKLEHDYGTIQQDANGDCEFKFKNVGKEPLVLSNVISSCGCTIPSWPKEPILPGKSASIKIHYDSHRVGTISKTITVLSNATEERVILTIKGNILAKPVEAVPEKPKSPVSNQ